MADFPEQPAVFNPNKRPISPEYAASHLQAFSKHNIAKLVTSKLGWGHRQATEDEVKEGKSFSSIQTEEA